jgi:hypothetical protein
MIWPRPVGPVRRTGGITPEKANTEKYGEVDKDDHHRNSVAIGEPLEVHMFPGNRKKDGGGNARPAGA